jgi:2-C-methyl-D-erythritol 2,4-cyclodiphosphate synthase
MQARIGHGYDIHRLEDGRPLWLGGVHVPFPRGLLGHSDGDVVLHATCDALLGALGEGDIGSHFPDTEARHAGAESAGFLRHVAGLVRRYGYRVVNVDVTVCAEEPRLAPYRDAMRARIADILGSDEAVVNIKAKTNEGLDAVGRGEAIAATAVVLLQRESAAPA